MLARKNFLTGQSAGEGLPKDVVWWNPEGREMDSNDWEAAFTRCFGMMLPGAALHEMGQGRGTRHSDSLLILMNAHHEDLTVKLPPAGSGMAVHLATMALKFDETAVTGPSNHARAVAGGLHLQSMTTADPRNP